VNFRTPFLRLCFGKTQTDWFQGYCDFHGIFHKVMSAGTYFNSATLAFWVIGLLNNMPFVIMLAGAKSISEGGTALVFIANSLPSLLVKISSPYWFDKVSYGERMMFGSILMTFSFCFVAVFIKRGDEEDDGNKIEGLSFNVCMQLLGVAFGSAQAGLGEATLLALSGKAETVIMNARLNNGTEENGRYQVIDESGGGYERDSNSTEVHKKSMCITAFSSGTGFAGIAGFLYVFSFTRILGLSLPGTLTVGLIFPILYFRIFTWYLEDFTRADLVNEEIVECVDTNNPASNEMVSLPSSSHAISSESALNLEDKFEDNPLSSGSNLNPEDGIEDNPLPDFQSDDEASDNSLIQLTDRVTASDTSIDTMTTCERFRLVLSLWPYMLPLFAVYSAEYALQSGVWAAIGFPVEDQEKRDSFYLSSNWVVS
jgi:hypothetical protein